MAPRLQPPAASTAANRNTTLMGKYQLGRLLGRGSFAKVYEACSISDGGGVAIKVIDKSKTVDAAMEPLIVREVDTMRRLGHPNILKIHEVMATKSKIYLVMELARGGDLYSKISRRGRLSEPAARRYFQQLAAALRHCHQNGVAHRDLKPHNLLLDEADNLKLSDFGLSALPDQLCRDGLLHTACGTPAYAAPEVIGCRGGYDGPKAEAWSCGVILFVLLAGFLPFDDRNLADMYRKIRRRDFHIPGWISKPARSIIVRLLDPNPVTRMSIEALMNVAWFKKSLPGETWTTPDEKECLCSCPPSMALNAFDIIAMSPGLDLSGLFVSVNRRAARFTSAATTAEVVERVREEGERQGYRVGRGQAGNVRLEKGKSLVAVKMLEVAPSLVVAEVKVVDGGAAAETETEELHWGNLKAGLGDLVLQWHNDGSR